jgi:hypothetical protein
LLPGSYRYFRKAVTETTLMIKRSAILLLLLLLVSGGILLITARPVAKPATPSCGQRCKPAAQPNPRMHWNFLTSALFPAES